LEHKVIGCLELTNNYLKFSFVIVFFLGVMIAPLSTESRDE